VDGSSTAGAAEEIARDKALTAEVNWVMSAAEGGGSLMQIAGEAR